MAARVTLKAVNDELARRGHHARLEKASGYFYFWSEDSADWIDRTVRVATLKSLTKLRAGDFGAGRPSFGSRPARTASSRLGLPRSSPSLVPFLKSALNA